MLDKQVVRLERDKLSFKDQLDFLACGGCKGIFPVSITEDEEGIKGYYKTMGFRKLSSFEEVSAADVLTLLEKTMEAVEECGQYLIFPEEFVISTDTAYVDGRFKEVKFTYLPSTRGKGWNTKLIAFIEELKQITTDNGKLYLDMVRELFSIESLSRTKIKAALLKLRHEIKVCSIT